MKITLKNLWKLFGLDKVDWKKATTRLLVVLWGILISSFIIKLFFGDVFVAFTNNQIYINICRYLEETKLYYLIYFPFYTLSMYLVLWIIARRKPNKKDLFIIIPIIVIYLSKALNESLGLILEILYYLSLSLIFSKNIWRAIETYIVMFIFQIISLTIKGVGIKINNEDVVTSLLTLFDYYSMLFIYCVNTIIRKEGIVMGLLGPILMSRKGKQLVAYRTKLLDKRAKLDSKIKDIDRAIENEKDK